MTLAPRPGRAYAVVVKRALAALVILAAVPLAAEESFIPMVAQRQGQDGAWWNTEVWVSNTGSSSGGFAAVFLPAGQGNLEGLQGDPELEEVPAGATIHRTDLVPQGGVGSLRILTTTGVVAVARVFNAAGRGSFGQIIPAMPRSSAVKPGEIAQLLGLRRTPSFRTNLALFNPTTQHGTVRVRVVGSRGDVVGEQEYRLAPGGYLQVDDALHAFGTSRGENLRAEVSGTVPFFAFASVVDTRSGAPNLVSPLR